MSLLNLSTPVLSIPCAIIPLGISSLTLSTPSVLSVPNNPEPLVRGVLLDACGLLALYASSRETIDGENVKGSPNVIVGGVGGDERRVLKRRGMKRGNERGSGIILSKLESQMGIIVGRVSASMIIRPL